MKKLVLPGCTLLFCDAHDALFPADMLPAIPYPIVLGKKPFNALDALPEMQHIVLLKQVHGVDGYAVTHENIKELLSAPRHEGDFLCTNMPGVGIGVLTADCLPIAFYDPVHKAVAMIHAGWRGTVAGIGQKTLACMEKNYGTQPQKVQVFLGPSAHACCYAVDEVFFAQFKAFPWHEKVFEVRNKQLYFNLPLCNALLLQDAGVKEQAISYEYAACTICNQHYCSYRRDAAQSCRQLTLIVLD